MTSSPDGARARDTAVRALVINRYTNAARRLLGACGSSGALASANQGHRQPPGEAGSRLETGPHFGPDQYEPSELGQLPQQAINASLGCGSPTASARLGLGYVVVDVACGGGIDSILASAAVGPGGRVIGIDASEAMIELANLNAEASGATNVSFVVGLMEALPLASGMADVVISNSSIHLSVEKARTLAELFRVLVPGGQLHAVDIVADDSLRPTERCLHVEATNATAGLLSRSEYVQTLTRAGFARPSIVSQHAIADRVAASIVTALKPVP